MKIGVLVFASTVAFASLAHGQEPKPPQLTPEEQKLAAEALKLNDEATQLYQRGKPAEAVGDMISSKKG